MTFIKVSIHRGFYNTMLSYDHIAPSMLPLFGILIGITVSILAYQDVILLPHLFIATIFFIIGSIVFLHYQPKAHTFLIILTLCSFLGFARHKVYVYFYDHYPFHSMKQPLSIHARVLQVSDVERSRYKQNYLVKASQAYDADGNPHSIATTLLIYSTQKNNLLVDDNVTFENMDTKPAKENPYKTYLLKEGISCTLFIDQPKIILKERPPYSLNRFLAIQQDGVTHLLSTKMNKDTYTYFLSLFMGDRSHNKWLIEKNTEHFKHWGILHYLARSGLHLVIFISLWQLIIRAFPLPFFFKQLILMILTILYYLLSVSSISFIRALVVFLLYKICIFFEKPAHFTHILCCTAILVLIYNPMYIMFLDFQLTFLLTLALGISSQLNLAYRS